jgi:hypothetical protein
LEASFWGCLRLNFRMAAMRIENVRSVDVETLSSM